MDAVARPLVSRTDLVRIAVSASTAALGAMGALLLARRAGGALTADLGAAPLAATLIVLAALIFGGRVLWRRSGVAAPRRVERALGWGGSAAIALVCLGCAWPGTTTWTWLLWLPVVVGDWFSRESFLRTGEAVPDAAATTAVAASIDGAGEEIAAEILQQLERVRGADGVESVRGTLRAEFAVGQRHATLYVGFCPPLVRLPVIEAELVDGPDATVKIVQALAHGARLELRLAEPADEPCHVLVGIAAAPSSSVL